MKTNTEELPLEIKVGQLIMAGFRGAAPPAHIMGMLRDGALGGVILFGDDSLSAPEIRRLTEGLQKAALDGASGLPLLMATDQEGGRVNRLSPPLTRFPSAGLLGAAGSAETAAELGRAMAGELLAVGVNMNLAPVLDILTNPENTVIGDRSLGDSVEPVSELGRALIRGMQETGMMATAKHFPGHGDTSFDSHDRLGTMERSEDGLWAREVLPFRAAIEEGVGAVMTAHVIYNELDRHAPATISPKIITGMLRERLGYRGLIVTDDLEMKAVTGNYSMEQAAVGAISAGADMVLVCKEKRFQGEAHAALMEAARSGRLSEERIDASVARILSTKEKYARLDYTFDIDTVCCPEHRELVRRIEDSAGQG